MNLVAGRERVGSCTPPDAFLHLVRMASIDGTQELLLPLIANLLRMVERSWLNWGGQLLEQRGAQMASQPSLHRTCSDIFQVSRHDEDAFKNRIKIAKDFTRTQT